MAFAPAASRGSACVSQTAHQGLKAAIAQVLGVPWRCTVHFLRDMLGHVAKAQQPMIATAIRQVFAAASRADASERLREVVERLAGPAPKVATLLEEAEPDVLAFFALPREHWSKLRSTNPLQRLDRGIGRRTDVVGIFPNDRALVRSPPAWRSSRTTVMKDELAAAAAPVPPRVGTLGAC